MPTGTPTVLLATQVPGMSMMCVCVIALEQFAPFAQMLLQIKVADRNVERMQGQSWGVMLIANPPPQVAGKCTATC